MIRYATLPDGTAITLKSLREAVEADATNHADAEIRKAVKNWVAKAKNRTAQLLFAKAYMDLDKWRKLNAALKAAIPKPLPVEWSSVKYLFMQIQNDKCAYCERKLAAIGDGGAAEHDLEHFRTKNPVKKWSAPPEIDFETGEALDKGYYWLAFHLLNYCTACKKCNTGFKSNYFPVAGTRLQPPDGPSVEGLRTEKPFLIYPLGTLDEDPEEVIRFRGLAACPPALDPSLSRAEQRDLHRNRRARVVIAFFDLNKRDELLWGRAEKLRELEKSLALINSGTPEQVMHAKADIVRLTDGFSEHTACIRAMLRICDRDLEAARSLFDEARAYLSSKTPTPYRKRSGQFERAPPTSA